MNNSRVKKMIHAYFRDPISTASFIIFMIIVIVCAASPLYVSEESQSINFSIARMFPCKEHIFGTDTIGRDLLGRILLGGRFTLLGGLKAAVISIIIGTIFGVYAGFNDNLFTAAILRASELIDCVPYILLVTMFEYKLGFGTGSFIYGLALAAVPATIQIVRAETMQLKNKEYIEAARALGFSRWVIILKHIMNNITGTIIMQFSINFSEAILAETILGYLSIGYATPLFDWGTLVSEGYTFVRGLPYLCFYPTIAVFITLISLNLISRGIRDVYERQS